MSVTLEIITFNPFLANVSTFWKHQKTKYFSVVFSEYEMGTSEMVK